MAKKVQLMLTESEIGILNALTEDELLAILACKRLEDLDKLLQEKCPEKKADLLAIAKKRAKHVKSSDNKALEALLDLLTPMSYVFLISDTVFTLVTAITLSAFIGVATGFFAIVAAVGIGYFIFSYKELQEKHQKKDNHYQLLALQNDCADAYVKSKNLECDLKKKDVIEENNKSDKKIWQKAKDSLGVGVLVGGTLFYTYYAITLALTIALAGSAAVAVMTGPIGIGVALGVAALIGIYFGYKKYQQYNRNKILEKDRKKMQNEVNDKLTICLSPKNTPENIIKHNQKKIEPGPVGFRSNISKQTSSSEETSSSENETRLQSSLNNPHVLHQPKKNPPSPMQTDSMTLDQPSSNEEKKDAASVPVTRSRRSSTSS